MTAMQAPRQVPGRPGTSQPPDGRGGPAVPLRIAFWLVALVLAVTMLGTTLPTPLYVIYQGRWHFSAAMVTVTFSILLAALSLFSIYRFARVVAPAGGDRSFLAVAVGGAIIASLSAALGVLAAG